MRSRDFSLTGSLVQHVAIPAAGKIIVHCYCYMTSFSEAAVTDVEIRVTGSFSSVGYHGDGKSPVVLPSEALSFDEVMLDDGTLRLKSRERMFIHSALVFDSVEIHHPIGTTVQFEQMSWSELHGEAQ